MSFEKYVFLDESGDLGFSQKSSNYFVITLLVTSEKKYIENKLKKYKTKLMRSKKYKKLHELKANNSNDKVRFDVLDIIVTSNVEIYTIILNKKITYDYLKSQKEKLYNYLTRLILDECDLNGRSVHFIIDKRAKKKMIRDDFDKYIKQKNSKVKLNISHFDSGNSHGLQLVDFISWSIFKNYESRDSRFIDFFYNKITYKKEF